MIYRQLLFSTLHEIPKSLNDPGPGMEGRSVSKIKSIFENIPIQNRFNFEAECSPVDFLFNFLISSRVDERS